MEAPSSGRSEATGPTTTSSANTVQNDLFDFSEMIGASNAITKGPSLETTTTKVDFQEVNETIFDTQTQTLGASTAILPPLSKRYKLFCAPVLSRDCHALCRSYIGQGSTVCLNLNYNVVHQGEDKSKIKVLPEQLFVQKSKGVVFNEPTLMAVVEPELLETWSAS